jgi:hypothetical protein
MPVSRESSYGVFPLDCGLRRNDEYILPGNDLSRTAVGLDPVSGKYLKTPGWHYPKLCLKLTELFTDTTGGNQ